MFSEEFSSENGESGVLGCVASVCLYLVLLRYSVLLAGVSTVGVRDRFLCAKGEELCGDMLVELGV